MNIFLKSRKFFSITFEALQCTRAFVKLVLENDSKNLIKLKGTGALLETCILVQESNNLTSIIAITPPVFCLSDQATNEIVKRNVI